VFDSVIALLLLYRTVRDLLYKDKHIRNKHIINLAGIPRMKETLGGNVGRLDDSFNMDRKEMRC
jgi:hypothetical protein